MDNKINIKRGRGRPQKTYEEKKNNRTTYMLNKEWYCEICNNYKNYTLAGKFCHLKTNKHINNMKKKDDCNFDIVLRIQFLDHLNLIIFKRMK